MSDAPPQQPAAAPQEPAVFAADGARLKPADRPSRPAAWHTDHRPPSRARGVVVAVLLLCVVGGLFVGLVVLPRRPTEPVFVSVPIGELDDPAWPVNPWADRDAGLLVPRFGGPSVKAFGFQQGDRFRALLGWVNGRDGRLLTAGLPPAAGKRPLILHLNALAVARGGEVFILPGDAQSVGPDGWVNVKDVLQAVSDRNAPHTLLILDLAHPVADPFGGILTDDVAAALDRILSDSAVPVLTACGPGETGLPADAAGCSAFAFYLAEGLSGAADGCGDPHGRDGEITVGELAQFVAARVDRWARMTHGRSQVPKLYGSKGPGADFVLVRRPSGAPPEAFAAEPYPDWLRDAWQERETARGGPAARRDPVAFARLTAGLLRAEALWLRPGPAQRAADVGRAARDRWAEAVARVPVTTDWTKLDAVSNRLAVARIGKPDAPPELLKARKALLDAKPEQEAEAKRAWAEAAGPHTTTAVGLVWEIAVDTARPSSELVEQWARAAGAANPVRPLAETRLLRALAARGSFRRQRLAMYPSDAVAALLRAEDELGRCIAFGPDEFAAGSDRLVAAAADRRAGAAALFTANTAEQVAAAVLLLERAAEGFKAGRFIRERTRQARRGLEAANHVLGETLPAVIEFDRPPLAEWLTLADAAARVAAKDLAAADPGDVAALTAGVARLCASYTPAVVEQLTGKDHRTDLESVNARRRLLAGAALGGAIRKTAWDGLLADTARLHAAVREVDAGEDRPAPPIGAHERESARAARRAEASIRLLRLAGATAVASEAEARLRNARAGGRSGDWAALGDRLRTAWLVELPARAAKDERVRWAVTPGLARYRPWANLVPHINTNDGFAAYRVWAEDVSRPLVPEEPQ